MDLLLYIMIPFMIYDCICAVQPFVESGDLERLTHVLQLKGTRDTVIRFNVDLPWSFELLAFSIGLTDTSSFIELHLGTQDSRRGKDCDL